jgi:hypothetical protein
MNFAIQEENEFRKLEDIQAIKDEFDRQQIKDDQQVLDEQTQLYLEIKLDIYRAKEEILKKYKLSWKKFYDMEDTIKRMYADKLEGIIYLHDGYTAEVTMKDITLHKGNGQIIGREVSHISIHKERVDNGKK